LKYNPNFKVDESQFDLILQHICEVWCDDQQNLFDYVTKWMAHLVQRSYKTGVALVFYSHKHGTGKTLLAEWFANHIIGAKNHIVAKNMADILSCFDGNLENKILTVLDEIGECGSKWDDEAMLKSLITRNDYDVELKGQEKRPVKDYNNYIFTTNCEAPIKVEGTDQRYCVLQCNDKYMGKQDEYFKPLIKQMNNPECSLHFFHWLIKLPLETDGKEFHPGTQIPKTECKQKMMAMVLCNIDLWFLNFYQTLKEIFDGKSDHNMLECNQNTIIDKDGNFVAASCDLYSMYSSGTKRIVQKTD